MTSWTAPNCHNDFRHELDIAGDADTGVRTRAHAAFKWLKNNSAERWLFAALERAAPLVPMTGLRGTPDHWRSPPPSGAGNCVGIVIGRGADGTLRCAVSNTLTRGYPVRGAGAPSRTLGGTTMPDPDTLDAPAIQAEIENAAFGGGHEEHVEHVIREGRRCATMPLFLVVFGDGAPHFYATTALAQTGRQYLFRREFTGEVVP